MSPCFLLVVRSCMSDLAEFWFRFQIFAKRAAYGVGTHSTFSLHVMCKHSNTLI